MRAPDPTNDLLAHLADLAELRPHGWPDPDLVLKPPFARDSVRMPQGWVWGECALGDALDFIEAGGDGRPQNEPPSGQVRQPNSNQPLQPTKRKT